MHRDQRPSGGFSSDAMNDDDPWDAFLADDDQVDPLPEPGDFWIADRADFDSTLESEAC